jgi:hypothetical protein
MMSYGKLLLGLAALDSFRCHFHTSDAAKIKIFGAKNLLIYIMLLLGPGLVSYQESKMNASLSFCDEP